MKKIKISLIASACALLANPVFAEGLPDVSFSGFGTIGIVSNDNSSLDFIGNSHQPNGAGATHSASFGPDSLLGLQMNMTLTKDFSGVVQVISQHQYDNTYTPQIEWGFLKYQVTPNLDLSVGRTALSSFALSDSRLVGYSYLWARPPIDVYYQVPLTSVDGVNASWRHDTSLGQLTMQGAYGSTQLKMPQNARIKGNDVLNLSATLESGPFTWRAGYTAAKLNYNSPEFDTLVSAYNQYGQYLSNLGATDLANEAFSAKNNIAIHDMNASFIDLGVSYDKDNWIAQAEWTKRKSGSVIVNTKAWHASAGYRFGQLTPYIGVSSLETTSNINNYPVVTGGNPIADTLNSTTSSIFASSALAQDTTTLGVKWNFRSNMDLKLQYDDIRFKQNTTGTLVNVTKQQGNSRAGITTLAVDFVF